jgi:predicted nucleotidyltransferase
MLFSNCIKDQIEVLCKRDKVKTLYSFGSVLNNQFPENSDVNLIVDYVTEDLMV